MFKLEQARRTAITRFKKDVDKNSPIYNWEIQLKKDENLVGIIKCDGSNFIIVGELHLDDTLRVSDERNIHDRALPVMLDILLSTLLWISRPDYLQNNLDYCKDKLNITHDISYNHDSFPNYNSFNYEIRHLKDRLVRGDPYYLLGAKIYNTVYLAHVSYKKILKPLFYLSHSFRLPNITLFDLDLLHKIIGRNRKGNIYIGFPESYPSIIGFNSQFQLKGMIILKNFMNTTYPITMISLPSPATPSRERDNE